MPVLSENVLTSDHFRTAVPPACAAQRTAVAAESLRLSGRLRLLVHGESMLPTLWPGDVVEIASGSLEDARRGDIVLALRDDRFFLHRFLGWREEGFLLRGDSMPSPDPQFPNQSFLGRLAGRVSIAGDCAQVRGVPHLRPWSRAMGWLLCHCAPARSLALRIYNRRKPKARETGIAVDPAGFRATDLRTIDFKGMDL